ncbi:MAG TPA: hypothetical protein VF556_17550 [Pyrinomonadaceae bacterium]|jgi:hypothetical protein
MEDLSLGTCCICESSENVHVLVTLDKKSPVAGQGWGCFVCNLPSDGANAVICDDCEPKLASGEAELKFACAGYPSNGKRIPIGELTGEHKHDLSMHKDEIFAAAALEEIETVDCRNCGCPTLTTEEFCVNCGETICTVCGCTESAACPGGCFWTRPGICSQCDAATADQF